MVFCRYLVTCQLKDLEHFALNFPGDYSVFWTMYWNVPSWDLYLLSNGNGKYNFILLVNYFGSVATSGLISTSVCSVFKWD